MKHNLKFFALIFFSDISSVFCKSTVSKCWFSHKENINSYENKEKKIGNIWEIFLSIRPFHVHNLLS